jgi:hypothetical protein
MIKQNLQNQYLAEDGGKKVLIHSVIKKNAIDSGKTFMFNKLNEPFIIGVKESLRNYTERTNGFKDE